MINTSVRFFTFSAPALFLAATLTACGGGGSDSSTSASGISTSCARNGNSVSVTPEGCVTEFGRQTQTVACSGTKTLHVLTGTGWTLEQLLRSGSKTTGNNAYTFNGVTLSCA